ncbi:MAG: peptide-binding protein [Planctomycetota bacterium]
MDNRIAVKDIILIILVLGVGVLVAMSMWMQDRRQWERLDQVVSQLEDQRESVNLYRQEIDQMKADQLALRTGVEQMSQNVGDMTAGVREMVEVLKQSAAKGSTNAPRLADNAGSALEGAGDVEFSAKQFDDDPSFYRVADLPQREGFAEGDFYIDAFSATVKSLTPLIAGDLYQDRISRYVLDTLLQRDLDTLEWEPSVAESWTVSEDGLTFTFKLRDDVKFSDGVPLTAHDVQFTYEWTMNPKVAAPRARAYYQKFDHIKALDDHTVEFKFREPYFAALGLCGEMQILAKHWYGKFSEDKFNETPGLLFGSGPYKMRVDPETWKPGSQKIELVRSDNYWGPRAPLDRVIWREILEDTAMEAEFRNGGVDRLGVRPASFRKLSRDNNLRAKANLYEYEYVNSGYVYIGWNQKKNQRATPFADKRVRQAMTMLIDRDTIAKRVYDNLWTTATGPYHPLGWQVDPTIKPWPYDPERAKQLLDEAGFTDRDGNGIRESPSGEPFAFKLIHSVGLAETTQMVLLMKDAMKKVGVDLQPDPLDWPAMQQKLDDRNFDAIMLGWGGVVDTDVYQMFHSDQIEDGGDNYTHYISPEIDGLIDEARKTVDRDKCQVLWRKVHAILHEDQPYTFMFNRKAVVYVDKRIDNVQITNMGMNYAWEFFVPAAQQRHTQP